MDTAERTQLAAEISKTILGALEPRLNAIDDRLDKLEQRLAFPEAARRSNNPAPRMRSVWETTASVSG